VCYRGGDRWFDSPKVNPGSTPGGSASEGTAHGAQLVLKTSAW
jgi:hypothetical protein